MKNLKYLCQSFWESPAFYIYPGSSMITPMVTACTSNKIIKTMINIDFMTTDVNFMTNTEIFGESEYFLNVRI